MAKPKMKARPKRNPRKLLPPPVKGSISIKEIDKVIEEASKEYKVINYRHGKEIEFSPECQPISWNELKDIVEREFGDEDDLLVMSLGACPLTIGTDDKQAK
ncbi:MAG: hypothetical protein WC459_01220 [Patescibacteria group bacterium]